MASLLLSVFAASALLLPSPLTQSAPAEKSFSLENGLRVLLVERHNVPLVNIVAAVNAGSKDETPATSGIIHLLEHCILFRGTEERSGGEVARDIRRHGATFNAHTGQDMAVFEISLPAENAAFGLRNQRDILFNLKLTDAEIAAEKDVILEELRQLKDDPFRYGGSLVYQNLFPGHPYGQPIIGTEASLRALTREDVEAFYRRFFVPGNSVLSIVGDFALADMEARVKTVFGDVPKADLPAPAAPLEKPAPPARTVEIEEALDVDEGYLVIGVAGPDYNDPDQHAADVLTQCLGQGIYPLLLKPLRSPRDLVNSATMTFIALKKAGAFVIYLTLDPKNIPAAKREALGYLRRLRNENFSKDDYPLGEERLAAFDHLAYAKNELRFLVQRAWESGLGLARSWAMHMLLNEQAAGIDYLERVAKISSSDLRKIGAKHFSRSEYVVVSIVPKKKPA
jgi:predicted Zn-dependent peptidase